jgi:hypothetical protein
VGIGRGLGVAVEPGPQPLLEAVVILLMVIDILFAVRLQELASATVSGQCVPRKQGL